MPKVTPPPQGTKVRWGGCAISVTGQVSGRPRFLHLENGGTRWGLCVSSEKCPTLPLLPAENCGPVASPSVVPTMGFGGGAGGCGRRRRVCAIS